MNTRIEDAKRCLVKAKHDYIARLQQVEGMLKVAVAQDPACVDEAVDVQRAYARLDEMQPIRLAPHEQPEVDAVPVVAEARAVAEGEDLT